MPFTANCHNEIRKCLKVRQQPPPPRPSLSAKPSDLSMKHPWIRTRLTDLVQVFPVWPARAKAARIACKTISHVSSSSLPCCKKTNPSLRTTWLSSSDSAREQTCKETGSHMWEPHRWRTFEVVHVRHEMVQVYVYEAWRYGETATTSVVCAGFECYIHTENWWCR